MNQCKMSKAQALSILKGFYINRVFVWFQVILSKISSKILLKLIKNVRSLFCMATILEYLIRQQILFIVSHFRRNTIIKGPNFGVIINQIQWHFNIKSHLFDLTITRFQHTLVATFTMLLPQFAAYVMSLSHAIQVPFSLSLYHRWWKGQPRSMVSGCEWNVPWWHVLPKHITCHASR